MSRILHNQRERRIEELHALGQGQLEFYGQEPPSRACLWHTGSCLTQTRRSFLTPRHYKTPPHLHATTFPHSHYPPHPPPLHRPSVFDLWSHIVIFIRSRDPTSYSRPLNRSQTLLHDIRNKNADRLLAHLWESDAFRIEVAWTSLREHRRWIVCGVWCVVCGAVYGVWCAVCGVWCVMCGV